MKNEPADENSAIGTGAVLGRLTHAADKANAAADRMEAVAHRIALLLEDGYGGNGLRLIDALEKACTHDAGTWQFEGDLRCKKCMNFVPDPDVCDDKGQPLSNVAGQPRDTTP